MSSAPQEPRALGSSHRNNEKDARPSDLSLSARVQALHAAIRASSPALCAERASLVTRYFRDSTRRGPGRRAIPMVRRKAEALSFVLKHKQVRIYPDELLVGCATAHPVGGGLYPELHGMGMMEDVPRFDRRAVNPLTVSPEARRKLLLEVAPYWLFRFLPMRAFPPLRALRFILDQLSATAYLINETGGISHFVPDYAGLLERGTEGYRQEVKSKLEHVDPESPAGSFLRGVLEVCDGLDLFADNYRQEAERLAEETTDEDRRRELLEIAEVCGRVPRLPARTLHEALQSILFAQIALNLESLDNGISPGRLDQVLWPLYRADLEARRIGPEGAFELLGCFALKLCELVPAFSTRVTRFHGGMMSGQAVIVGGTDRDGADATNGLTWMWLELMDQLRTRQPNYHARIHPGSPLAYRARIAAVLAGGAASPAVYNDTVIAPLLANRGATLEEARDYATVGCVEPQVPGRSFLSTDAALVNLPLALELALNRGRRFGHWRRMGADTPAAESCGSIEALIGLFRTQLNGMVDRLHDDLAAIEVANARFHPTPLASMLIQGCVDSGRDATEGGAIHNGSGVQGVGVVEVGDSLAAVEWVVFRQRAATLLELVEACRSGFQHAPGLKARLREAPKYGNDNEAADRFVAIVMEIFAASLARKKSRRGGDYVAGYYSMTCHQAFGEAVGALPSGRGAGEAFSSGIAPGNGRDRKGPTAVLGSAARLPMSLAPNGVNLNLKLAPGLISGENGPGLLQALIDGGFRQGCMQMQINVIDPAVLIEARDHPGRHPGLLVRVSGYSAYFDDLSPKMKQEVIDRTLMAME